MRNRLNLRQNKIPFAILIGLLIILGYWQIGFFTASFKWDMIDVVFPFRYYFSQCLHAGYFPFWNPFQQTGTPFYADLQAPTYYPELLYTSLLGGYSVYTLHILFIGYLMISAWGMYQLAFYFNKNKNASFIAALAYVFSGYIIAHAQHFFLLVGMAWIPWVILSYIKLHRNLNLINTIKTAIFVFLMITGAYQALSIALMYLLLLLLAYYIIKSITKKERANSLRILKFNLLLALIVVILTLPLIVSTLEVLHSVTRLEAGINLQQYLALGQPLSALFSFVAPFSTISDTQFYANSDISLINYYFGIVMLMFFLISLFKKHTIPEYFLLLFGLLIFAMAFSFLPVRKWMWQYVPLMNSFKYASYLSIYGIMAFILFASDYFAVIIKNILTERKKIITISTAFLAIFIFLIVLSYHKLPQPEKEQLLTLHSFSKVLSHPTFFQSVFIQSAINFILVSSVIGTLAFYKKVKYTTTLLILLIATDLILAAQLNMRTTVVDVKYTPKNLQTSINLCPKGFPVPVNDKVIYNNTLHAFFAPFWRNTYIFTKQISFTGFSSFKLNSYNEIDKFKNLKTNTLNHHLFYFSDTVIPLTKFSNQKINIDKSNYLFVSKQDFKILSGNIVKTDSSDLIKILKFKPNEAVVRTTTKNNLFLTMLQTNYKGWRAFIDNKPTPVYTSNFNYRTLFLPKGKHIVSFRYKNDKIRWLYIVSNIVFIFLVLFLLGYRLFKKNRKSGMHIYVPAIILSFIIILLFLNFSHKDKNSTEYEYYISYFKKKNNYFGEKQDFEGLKKNYDTIQVFSGKKSAIIEPGREFFPLMEVIQKDNNIKEGTLFVTAHIFSHHYPDALLVSEIKKVWHASKIETQIERINHWNTLFYVRHIPKMKKGDVLKIYIWNPHKSKFLIDDVSIGFFN